MDIKAFYQKNRTLVLTIGGVLLALIVFAAIYLPGTLFTGTLPILQQQSQTAIQPAQQQQLTLLEDLDATCEITPDPVRVGDQATMTAIATGGPDPGNYTYLWTSSAGDPNIHQKTTQSVSTVFPSEGIYEHNLIVKSGTDQIIKTCNVTVESALPQLSIPLNVSCSISPDPARVGDDVTLTAIVSGGLGPGSYSYLWTSGEADPKIHQQPTETVTTQFTDAKLYEHNLTVKSGTQQKTMPCNVDVLAALPQLALNVSCDADPDPAEVGEEVTWTVTATGGGGPQTYSYSWSAPPGDPDISTETTESVDVTYTEEGTKSVEATVTSGNEQETAVCNAEIITAAKALSAVCTVSPSSVNAGETVTWSVNATGGTGTYDYEWIGEEVEGETTEDVDASYDEEPSEAIQVKVTSGTDDVTVDCPQITIEEAAELPVPAGISQCNDRPYPNDISGHWAESYIKRGYDLCILKGFDGEFRPDMEASRLDAASMLLYAKGMDPDPGCYDFDCGTPFLDLESTEQGSILRPLYFADLIEGYENNRFFKPNNTITRAEAASLIVRAFFEPFEGCYTANCGAGWPDNFFTDIKDFWQGQYIRVLWDKRIMEGVRPNSVEPNREITRAEMAKLIVLSYEATH